MKRIIILVLAGLMAAPLLWAEKTAVPEQASARARVVLDLLFEKKGEGEANFLLDEAEMTVEESRKAWGREFKGKSNKEKVQIIYPKMQIIPTRGIWATADAPTIDKIKFYGKHGETLNVLEKKGQLSDFNSEYLTTGLYGLGGGSLYSTRGEKLWEVDNGYYPAAVNKKGYSIVATEEELIFYDTKKKELSRINRPGNDYNMGSNVDFIDGDYAVLFFRPVGKTIILLTTNTGKIIWRNEYEYEMFKKGEYAAIRDLGFFGVSNSKGSMKPAVHFIDWNGNLKWSKDIEAKGDIKTVYDGTNKLIHVISTAGYLWTFDVAGNSVAKYNFGFRQNDRTDLSKPLFRDLLVADGKVYVMGKDHNQLTWNNSCLFVFDINRKELITKQEFLNERISLTRHGKTPLLLDHKKGKLYQIKIDYDE